MNTGAPSLIGPTGIPAAIDCAIDGAGQMYTFDIMNDEAYKVDKTTGASILLGSIGYDANYSQGMGWDPAADIIYIAAFNDANGTGELRILDRETGNTLLVGTMGGEIDGLAFPGTGASWVSIDPGSDTIAPGGSQVVTVTFDGNYIPPQKELNLSGNIIFITNPDVGSPQVTIQMSLTGEFNGVLEGNATHGGYPLEGATVTAKRTGTPVYSYTMVTGADGSWSFPAILYGTYDITAVKSGFNPFSSAEPVVVSGGQTSLLDIAMTAPTMVIDPLEINEYVPFGTIVTKIITVTNTGDGLLHWNAEVATDNKQKVSTAAGNGRFPRGTAALSIGKAPALKHSVDRKTDSQPSPIPRLGEAGRGPFNPTRGTPGYAFDIYPGYTFFSFDTDDPATQNVICPINYRPYGGTFDAVNTDFMYVIDHVSNKLKKVAIATGDVTDVGTCNPPVGETWTGITVDKTTGLMYGISTSYTQSTLSAIDMATGASTVIGTTGIPAAIDVAIDGTGQMYSFDIANDESYRIDKETGTSTLIGSIGFDANYAQGMGWDPVSDIIYLAACNNYSETGELRILDRETGNTTYVGEMGGEIDALAFPGGILPQWLTIDKESGILPAGASEEITVTLDGNYIPPRNFLHGTITFSSDPDVGTIVVPVTMSGYNWYGTLEGYVTHGGTGVPNATVSATRGGHFTYTATTNEYGHYLIHELLPGTYEVSAEAAGFHPYLTTGVIITPEGTTTLDIPLTAPSMSITPMSLEVYLAPGQTTIRMLNIFNGGDGSLVVQGSVHNNRKQAVATPAGNREFQRGTAAPSFGRAPVPNPPDDRKPDDRKTDGIPSLLPRLQEAGRGQMDAHSGSIGYAFDIYPGNTFFLFNTDDPWASTIIIPINYAPFGGSFDAINTDFMYVIDYNSSLQVLASGVF
ncbi:MAG: carboxypeptidase regulatory-like domain-containing protein [Bacteroidota bacterium]